LATRSRNSSPSTHLRDDRREQPRALVRRNRPLSDLTRRFIDTALAVARGALADSGVARLALLLRPRAVALLLASGGRYGFANGGIDEVGAANRLCALSSSAAGLGAANFGFDPDGWAPRRFPQKQPRLQSFSMVGAGQRSPSLAREHALEARRRFCAAASGYLGAVSRGRAWYVATHVCDPRSRSKRTPPSRHPHCAPRGDRA
jgi:hypothetical protein